MTTEQQLKARHDARQALLERAASVLEADRRVAAAWMFGSLGRGTDDVLSDLDLFVVVADAQIEDVLATRREMIAAIGEPTLILDAPQNRPPQGAYHMALYPGETGPYQIDWYWQPQRLAQVPQETRLLFDRVGLPHLKTPTQFTEYQSTPERTPLEAAVQSVNFFWCMLLIAAKYAARNPHEERMGLIGYVQGPLREVGAFVGENPGSFARDDAPHPKPDDKLRLLRGLADEMTMRMPQVAALGGAVPRAMTPQAHRYLDFVAALIAAGWNERKNALA